MTNVRDLRKEEARPLEDSMGVAVARRTVFRDEDQEDMGKVADRVATGNLNLVPRAKTDREWFDLRNMIARGGMPTSGRHLQHGDETQPGRNIEVMTNCSSAALSFSKFYLLLNGSGVGRSYSDDMMVVNWANSARIITILSEDHPDYPKTDAQLFAFAKDFGILNWRFEDGKMIPPRWADFTDEVRAQTVAYRDGVILTAAPMQDHGRTLHHEVADSREGWAKALEVVEAIALSGDYDTIFLDFSKVRENGAAIKGMQNRPASGPLSVMRAFINLQHEVMTAARRGLPLWHQAMIVDHLFSVEVQVGGARRAARMAVKYWKDKGIFEFIKIKAEGGLWTSNNSVGVDQEFWDHVNFVRAQGGNTSMPLSEDCLWAWNVFLKATEYAFVNGEPGFINLDHLESNKTGRGRERVICEDGSDFGSEKYQADWGKGLLAEVARAAKLAIYPMIINPCSEIELHTLGGYCTIGDVAPLFCAVDETNTAQWDDEAEKAVRLMVRFLMRVNTMDSLYATEVARTNRIGVSLTGVHEWAFARFGLTFRQLLDEHGVAAPFWQLVSRLSDAAKNEALIYAGELGVEVPHTVITVKPAGTTSKLYGLSEGAHLPAMRQYLRWVQYRGQKDAHGAWTSESDPLLARYEAMGYPIRELESFPGMSIVGFPTIPLVCQLMPQEKIVTAGDATPEEQYQWLMLLEKYWLGPTQGNQISYTMKIYTTEHSLEDFRRICAEYQSQVRACALLPSVPEAQMGFEYLPEESVPIERMEEILADIAEHQVKTDIDMDTLACASGACPI